MQLQSQLLSVKAWDEVSYLLSDESTLSVYYLEQLWGEGGFRCGWTRLREAFTAKWQEQAQGLVQQVMNGDTSLLEECVAEVVAGVSGLAESYPIPFRVRVLLGYLLLRELLQPLGVPLELLGVGLFGLRHERYTTRLTKLNTFVGLSKTLQLPPALREYLPAQLGVLLVAWELSFQNVAMLPPLVGLPLPLRSDSKEAYLKRVQELLRTSDLLQEEFAARFCLKGSKFAFSNPSNATVVILALAEEYHAQCKTRASNRNDAKLRRYARQVYLRVVKRKTWGEIVDILFAKELEELSKRRTSEKELREQREKWRVLVIMTTRKACEILGIPSD
jgi:hypothetical protein